MKYCSKCNQTRPLDLFGKDRSAPDGRSYYCKPCRRLYDKKRYIPTSGHLRKQKGKLLWCNGCEEFLPPDNFNKYTKAKSGRNSRCKPCVKEAYRPIPKPKEQLPPNTRRCTGCKTVKKLAEYHKCSREPLGVKSTCKQCRYRRPNISWDDHNLPFSAYHKCKGGSKDRQLEFTLTLQEFSRIISKCCVYCGTDKGIGIDRVDNTQGYLYPNCSPYCGTCNFMKRCLAENEFKVHIRKIHEHLNL